MASSLFLSSPLLLRGRPTPLLLRGRPTPLPRPLSIPTPLPRLRIAASGVATTPSPTAVAITATLRCGARSLFFTAIRDRPGGYLNTPLTVVAAGMSRWLDIYSGVLMVRVLLSWFPNIPWERQPLSAIRDLCDPYLNLFCNIIPPIFDTLDVSPLLAFAVLGTLASILNNARGAY